MGLSEASSKQPIYLLPFVPLLELAFYYSSIIGMYKDSILKDFSFFGGAGLKLRG